MRKVFTTGLVAFLATMGLAFTGTPASAAEGPVKVESKCLTDWYVNHDETDRKPESVENGYTFKGDDLVHHEANGVTVDTLQRGTFKLADGSHAPDQDSFFSVEVMNEDGTGYATLRWNTADSEWNMVVSGTLYKDADPAKLVEKVDPAKSKRVMSFGVGYTKNPPGTKTVTVESVTFQDKTYGLTCKPVRPVQVTEKDFVNSATCEAAATLKDLPTVDHVTYTRRLGTKGQTVVTAKANEGYYIVGNSRWNLELPGKLDAKQCVVPEKPQTWDPTCEEGPLYQDQTAEYTYTHEGLPTGGGWYTVKAVAKEGFAFKPGVTTEWTIKYKAPTGCDNTPPTTEPTTGTGGNAGGGTTPAPETSNVSQDEALPVTGPSGGKTKLIVMLGIGGLLVSVGGLLMFGVRRRKVAGTVESA